MEKSIMARNRVSSRTIASCYDARTDPNLPCLGGEMSKLILECSVLLAAMLGTLNLACAASFDCHKARTKVEKMVCSSPELSKLDGELGVIYSKALADPTMLAGEVSKNQKGWLKWDRNLCGDIPCLKKEYHKQIAELQNAIAVKFSAPEHKYPPYPDVWQQMFPVSNGERWDAYAFFKFLNGDYISFFNKKSARQGDVYLGKSFFGGETFGEKEMNAAFYKLKVDVGPSISANLASHTQVSMRSLDYRMQHWCPQALNNYYEITYQDGHKERKSLLYFLDKPKRTSINDHCGFVQEIQTSYVKKVSSLSESLVQLDGGGCLLIDSTHGVVIRFDSHFHTQSPWFKKHVIVVDTSELEKLGATQFETMNYQHMQDVVYAYLKKLKQKGKE